MGIFARNRQLEQEREPDYLQHVQATAAGLERAQQARDQAIVAARRHHKLADVAAAAGLSLSRVKQIVAPYDRAAVGPMAKLLPITENDLYLERWDKALHDGHRVLALKDVVDFDLEAHTFDSEREFLLADPARHEGDRPDIAWELYDLDPTERWVAAYILDYVNHSCGLHQLNQSLGRHPTTPSAMTKAYVAWRNSAVAAPH